MSIHCGGGGVVIVSIHWGGSFLYICGVLGGVCTFGVGSVVAVLVHKGVVTPKIMETTDS